MIYQEIPPDTDQDLQTWSSSFSTKLSAAAVDYGATVQQAADLAALVADYSSKLAAARDSATRGDYTISQKETSKGLLLDYCRALCKMIGGNPDVTKDQREFLGLHIRRRPSRQNPPTNVPTVEVHMDGPTSIGIRAHSGDALVRRLPAGVLGMTVWTYLGSVPPLDVKQWECQGPFTRPTAEFDFGLAAANPTRAWVAVCWFNRRGSGPVSMPQGVNLGGLSLSEQIELEQQQEPQGPQLVGEDPLSEAA